MPFAWQSDSPATTNHIEAAFSRLLLRPAEDRDTVTRWAKRGWTVAELSDHVRMSSEFQARAKIALTKTLSVTDDYQAVYKIPEASSKDSRSCNDRCMAIMSALEQHLGLKNLCHLRIADIGCSMGYISLFFADRGAEVRGYDIRRENVAFCEQAALVLDISAEFQHAAFGDGLVDRIAIHDGSSTVFLLSVLHHIIHDLGVEKTRSLLGRLLDAGITLVCELATKREDVAFSWMASLPDDELAVFDTDTDSITWIGEFEALNGRARRPMYLVQRRRFGVNWLSNTRSKTRAIVSDDFALIYFSAVKHVPVRYKQYAQNDQVFCKLFRTSAYDRSSVLRRFEAEYFVAQLTRGYDFTPKLLGTIHNLSLHGLVFENVAGARDLHTWSSHATVDARRNMAIQIAEKLAVLGALSVYWNDCRDHNILISRADTVLFIDFEIAGPLQAEDNLRRARFLLWHLCQQAQPDFEADRHLATPDLPPIPAPRAKAGFPEWSIIDGLLEAV